MAHYDPLVVTISFVCGGNPESGEWEPYHIHYSFGGQYMVKLDYQDNFGDINYNEIYKVAREKLRSFAV